MPQMTGAEAIVHTVRQHGVDTIFALPGAQLDPVFNALYDHRNEVRVIHTRHEQGAAYMAFGYARATGREGVYAVVPGPGLLNTTTALCTAYACNTPVLCLTGQIPSDSIGKGHGRLHELPDQLALIKGLTKWAERIDSASEAPGAVAEAFKQLRTGRPRPVELEMAWDTMERVGDVSLLGGVEEFAPPGPDPDLIEKAAKLLGAAKNPVIFVGAGSLKAGEPLLALAEMLQAPVVSFRGGRGIVSDTHYLSQAWTTGHTLWKTADVVLATGTRLQSSRQLWGEDDDLKVIHIDIDEVELTRISTPTVGIAADANLALRALVDVVPAHNLRRPSREVELTGLKNGLREELSSVLAPQMAYLKVIRDLLPEDGFFVDEVTQMGFAAWLDFPMSQPGKFISSSYQGTLGYGYATALGMQIGAPDKKVISISGDGGFMFNVQELATAVLHNIGLVNIVFKDGHFGNVRRMQQELYGGKVFASDLANPDFVAMAESFGAAGYRAESPEELATAIAKGFDTAGPVLIEVPVGELPSPWPYLLRERVRGLS